jgi:hypothetical protein
VPSTSKKQHNFMAAVAKNPKFAKKVGVPTSVGQDFLEADKGKKFRKGGTTNPMRAGINKQTTHHGMMQMPNASLKKFRGFKEGGEMKHSDIKQDMPMMKKVAKAEVKAHEKSMHKMAKGGVTRADGIIKKGHTKGTIVKMCGGGMAKGKK